MATTIEMVEALNKSAKLPDNGKKVINKLDEVTKGFKEKLTTKVKLGKKEGTPKDFIEQLFNRYYEAPKKEVKKPVTKKKSARRKKTTSDLFTLDKLAKTIQREMKVSYAKASSIAKKIIDNKSAFKIATAPVDGKKRTAKGIVSDYRRDALPKGKRISANGNVYYEYRSNRSDLPIKPTIKLAKGGRVVDISDARIYVASLYDYNRGSLDGAWLDLDDYTSGSEVMEAIDKLLRSIDKKYKRPLGTAEEYAIHDYEGFPSNWYSEYMSEDDFDKIYEFYDFAEGKGYSIDFWEQVAEANGWDLDDLIEKADDITVLEGVTARDLGNSYVEAFGFPRDKEYYFDAELYGESQRINMSSDEYEQYEDMTDEEVGEEFIENGLVTDDELEMYFDYNKFGRELDYDFTQVKDGNDYYYVSSNMKQGGIVKQYSSPSAMS